MAGQAEQKLWDSLQPPEKISLPRAAAGWTLVTGAVLLLLWATGPVRSTLFPQDVLGQVEAGHRFLLGQPLNDGIVTAPWGSLYVWLVALGLRISGTTSPPALHWVQAISVVVFGLLLYLVALPRLRLAWALFLLAAAELLLITATPLGHNVWREFGYAAYYNTICFVPLAALLLSILIPRPKSTTAGRWCDVLLEGLSLALLFALSAWYAVGAVAAYVLIRCLWPRPGEKRRWGLAALALFAGLAVVMAKLAGNAWNEVAPAANPLGYVQFSHTWSAAGVAVLIALLFAHQCAVPWRRLVQPALYSLAAMGAFMLGTYSSSMDLETMPFIGVAPLAVVLFAARTANEKKAPLGRLALYCALLIAALLLATAPKNSLLSRTFMHMTVKSFTPAKAEGKSPTP